MSRYATLLTQIEQDTRRKKKAEKELAETKQRHQKLLKDEQIIDESLTIISSLADKQLEDLLSNIEDTINPILSQIFVTKPRKIRIDKALLRATNPQLKAICLDPEGFDHDFSSEGSGIKQIVSVLFSLIVISIRGDRPLVILDETLRGLHNHAKRHMERILELFAKDYGYQFFIVEYGSDNFGTMYNVQESPTDNTTSVVIPINGNYDPNELVYTEPDLDGVEIESEEISDWEE